MELNMCDTLREFRFTMPVNFRHGKMRIVVLEVRSALEEERVI